MKKIELFIDRTGSYRPRTEFWYGAGGFGPPEQIIALAGKVNELASQVRELIVFGGLADA